MYISYDCCYSIGFHEINCVVCMMILLWWYGGEGKETKKRKFRFVVAKCEEDVFEFVFIMGLTLNASLRVWISLLPFCTRYCPSTTLRSDRKHLKRSIGFFVRFFRVKFRAVVSNATDYYCGLLFCLHYSLFWCANAIDGVPLCFVCADQTIAL